MNNQSAPQSSLSPKVPVPHHHLIPVIAVMFAMAAATAIFAWIIWPKDSDVDATSTKMNLKGNANTEQTFTTNASTNGNVNAVVSTNTNRNSNVNAGADATKDWKTYQDVSGVYSFMYARNAVVTVVPSRVDIRTADGAVYSLTVTTKTQPAVSNKVSNPECYRETSTRTLNGVAWSVNETTCALGGESSVVAYVTTKGEYVYEFSYDRNVAYDDFEQIVETFTFTK